jgi:hypothetical protein
VSGQKKNVKIRPRAKVNHYHIPTGVPKKEDESITPLFIGETRLNGYE